MRLDLDADAELFRDSARGFLTRMGGVGAVRELAEQGGGFDRAWWRDAAELGWTSLLVPDHLGGMQGLGRGVVDVAIVAEVMGEQVSPGPLLPCNVVAAAVAEAGSPAHQEQILPGIASGELVAAWCPPGAGTVVGSPVGDGVRLRGEAHPIEAADQADVLLVAAEIEGRSRLLLVPTGTDGVHVEALESLDLVRHLARVRFDDAVVAADTVLPGSDGRVEDLLLSIALVLQSAECTGAAARIFETTVSYAFDRRSFGRPLASYQALKHRFADMALWLECCQATTDAAADAVGAGAPDALRLARIAKAYTADHAAEVIQDCIQLHGSIGVTWEHDLHLYLRRVTVDRALLGSPADQRVAIGRDLTTAGGPGGA